MWTFRKAPIEDPKIQGILDDLDNDEELEDLPKGDVRDQTRVENLTYYVIQKCAEGASRYTILRRRP